MCIRDRVHGVLERGGEGVVVLGGDDDEGVRGADALGVGRHLLAAVPQFVGADLGEVEHVDHDVVAPAGVCGEPARDDGCEPALAGAGDDDGEGEGALGHGGAS